MINTPSAHQALRPKYIAISNSQGVWDANGQGSWSNVSVDDNITIGIEIDNCRIFHYLRVMNKNTIDDVTIVFDYPNNMECDYDFLNEYLVKAGGVRIFRAVLVEKENFGDGDCQLVLTASEMLKLF